MIRIKLKALILIIAIISMVSIALTSFIYSNYIAKETKIIPVEIIVEHKLGFNTDTDLLRFGTIPPGSQGMRYINVTHTESFPMKVRISALGEIAGMLSADKNDFFLDPGVQQTIKVIASIPEDTLYGNYTGELYVIFSRR